MSKFVVIGAGFGGLTAAAALRKKAPNATITLIAPKREFVYYPSLIWVPTKLRKAEDLIISLDHFLRIHRIEFHQGTVTGLEQGGRVVVTDTGPVANDGLIMASGGRFIRKLPGIENAIVPCSGIKEAQDIHDRLHAMMEGAGGTIAMGFGGNPNEPSGVRGGPMFEFLFGIDTYLRKHKMRAKFNLVFFSPAPKPGIRMGEKAVDKLLGEMKKRDIQTHLGHKMKAFEADKVVTEGGDFSADMILFMPGLTGPAWVQDSGLPLSPGGMVQADMSCKVQGWEKTYVVGDTGSYQGGPDWMPKQAHMADLQAKTAVQNLLAEMNGQPADKTFRVELICIVDTLNSGTMVYRDLNKSSLYPMFIFGHWLKRMFEHHYLKAFR
ncbi:NAD(P)/FAD-dependent oxidoreductase [Magnetovibrio blakemorei]|uniref:Pyridine nucleotide-disulfide oxidoreductase n=1 Tax=Magnetovibrio blakemorei TaxID=28181 RepID=A0A1E5Q5P9_9PROT|nr:FAD-dependent oxidoreductase [Magnetovibrio blakemorei]OEJ65954.1 pyridine nucleotide-disulfide oxidoreductase [Magnetovibrio blakemorei]